MITDTHILIEEFLAQHDVIPDTRDKYRNMLSLWCDWLTKSGISWLEARKPHVIRFRDEMAHSNKSSLYINCHLNLLNKFYDYLQDANHYPLNIAANVKKMERYKGYRKDPLELEQVYSLLNSIDTMTKTGKRDMLAVKLMLISGLRCCEVSRLNTDDIYLDKKYISVRGKGKTEKVRVNISDDVAEELRLYLGKRINKTDEPVFLVWEKAHISDRMTPAYIGIRIKMLMVAAGIDDKMLTAHSLRHTCATQLILAGNSIRDVQLTLRHSTSTMTENYIKKIDEQMRIKLNLPNMLEKTFNSKQIAINFKNNLNNS